MYLRLDEQNTVIYLALVKLWLARGTNLKGGTNLKNGGTNHASLFKKSVGLPVRSTGLPHQR